MSHDTGRWAVGLDLGGSSIKSGLVCTDGTLDAFERTPLDRTAGPDRVLECIRLDIERLLTIAGSEGIEPVGVGVGSPGSIDREEGLIRKSPNFTGLDAFPLRDHLRELTTLPLDVANDVNAAALGELKFGAGRNYHTFAMVALGTGVGGGIILDGRLHQGALGYAGEVGHMTVNPEGPVCTCGNVGCLEMYVGAPGLVGRAREILADRQTASALADIPPGELSPRAISSAADGGDSVALQVLEEAGRWLGIAFISIINLLDPQCILVGGGVSQAGSPLFDSIRRTVTGRTMAGPARGVPILKAALGPKAGTFGAGALALWPELT